MTKAKDWRYQIADIIEGWRRGGQQGMADALLWPIMDVMTATIAALEARVAALEAIEDGRETSRLEQGERG